MRQSELVAYRRAGELYGRLRSALVGGTITMVCDPLKDGVEYLWRVRRDRKELKLTQACSFKSLMIAVEIESLAEKMIACLLRESDETR